LSSGANVKPAKAVEGRHRSVRHDVAARAMQVASWRRVLRRTDDGV
jgi:hypothetical protein